ncbi:MAG: DUF6973 domain-containing protein, partial [Candidatus Binatia bacterium]
ATVDGTASSAYVYDKLGRQTTIPAADTPNGTSAGNITLGYYDTDAGRLLTQNGVTTTLTLDPGGRRSREVTTGDAAGTVLARHYTDTSDNPGWAVSTTETATTTSWYGASVAGDLGIEVVRTQNTSDGSDTTNANLTLADPLGSIATTLAIPAAGTQPQISAVGTFDEYGNTIIASTSSGAISYAWLGAKERATNPATGLLLMGVRIYNGITGSFTSVDPVLGGNTTAYTYPQDPINKNDLSGRFMSRANFKRHLYETGMCLSLGKSGCALVITITFNTIKASKKYKGKKQNAIRHIIWSSMFTAAFGPRVAKRLTDSHELFQTSRDSRVDQKNNRAGRTLMPYSTRYSLTRWSMRLTGTGRYIAARA